MNRFHSSLANSLLSHLGRGRQLIAIDGVDGSGKSTFAAKLIAEILGRPTILIHADDFLNSSEIRHAKGRSSPLGFWEDTYNYDALIANVLDPLSPDGTGLFSPIAYDVSNDEILKRQQTFLAPSNAIVVIEGMFLHRDELASYWDASVFLDVPFAVTAARMSVRNGSNPDPEHPSMNRYVGGQKLYFADSKPWERATLIVDNSDYTHPRLIAAGEVSADY